MCDWDTTTEAVRARASAVLLCENKNDTARVYPTIQGAERAEKNKTLPDVDIQLVIYK
jgi:hypothetical protein